MFIYAIKPKDETKEIYIGKTNNITKRLYAHKYNCKNSKQLKYSWMREKGWDNLLVEQLYEYDVGNDNTNYEKQFIDKYKDLNYIVINEQMNDYHPCLKEKFEYREEAWKDCCSHFDWKKTCDKFDISKSLLSKIMKEHNGSLLKGKLFNNIEIIQKRIMNGEPIRALAKDYGVCKNSITNINKGITGYNPDLSYPLNEAHRQNNLENSWFKKSKV